MWVRVIGVTTVGGLPRRWTCRCRAVRCLRRAGQAMTLRSGPGRGRCGQAAARRSGRAIVSPDVTKLCIHLRRVRAPAGDHGVVPGGAGRPEEGGLIELLAAGELPTPAMHGPAAVAMVAVVLVRRLSMYWRTCCPILGQECASRPSQPIRSASPEPLARTGQSNPACLSSHQVAGLLVDSGTPSRVQSTSLGSFQLSR